MPRIIYNAWVLLIVLLGISPCSSVRAGGEIFGRITARDTGYGIEGATIRLFASPEGVVVISESDADSFGYYRLRDLAPGTYRIEAAHPAYHSVSELNLIVKDLESAKWLAALDPIDPGKPVFDIYFEVMCATTGLQLDHVPVELFVSPLDGAKGQVRTLKTDSDGSGQFRGLPQGWYTFTVNTGPNKIPGWDSIIYTNRNTLLGPHHADIRLKPEERTLLIAAYGYDPVKQLDNSLLGNVFVELTGYDFYESREILPGQVGVTGIWKDNKVHPNWNNQMVGKVQFGRLPPIVYLIEAKRLGYRSTDLFVHPDGQAQFPPGEIRVDLPLLDTRITVVLDSPYHDPEVVDGLKVQLAGLEKSNTEGILREETARFSPDNQRTTAVFERLLPGRYRIMAHGQGQKVVPVIVEGSEFYANDPNGPKKFTINFNGTGDLVDAVPDENREFVISMSPQSTVLRGTLLVVEDEWHELSYYHQLLKNKKVEIHASEYYKDHMPAEAQFVVAESDETGEFVATLLPGLYGIRVADMSEYWGESVEINTTSKTNPNDVSGSFDPWPYFQKWPSFWGADSAQASRVGLGGLTMSSDREMQANFFIRRDQASVDVYLGSINSDPTASKVVSIDRSKTDNTLVVNTIPYYHVLSGATISLTGGGSNWTSPVVKSYSRDGVHATFDPILPARKYQFSFAHDRYSLTSPSFECRFSYYDYSPPGYMPATEPPDFSYTGPQPLTPANYSLRIDYRNPGKALFEVQRWEEPVPGQGQYVTLAYNRRPNFLTTDYTGNELFYYLGYTPPTPYEVWLNLTDLIQDGQEHWYHYTSSGGNLSGTVFLGGPQNSEANKATPLGLNYELKVIARNDKGTPDEPDIRGVRVVFNDGSEAISGEWPRSGPMMGYDFRATNVIHPDWLYSGRYDASISGPRDSQLITLVLYMRQELVVRGQVVNRDDTNCPIPRAFITIKRAQGNEPVNQLVSKANGRFDYRFPFGRQVYFIELLAKGYEPYRRRLDPDRDGLNESGSLIFEFEGTNAIQLKPMPAPSFLADTIEVDRFGAFIPGVKRAGNQQAWEGWVAENELTMTWKLQVKNPTNRPIVLPDFDDRDGNRTPDRILRLFDPIKEVWLIDLRSFATNIYLDPPTPLAVPSTVNPHLVHEWLDQIRKNDVTTPNVYHQGHRSLATTSDTNIILAAGGVRLWELPPEQFKPAFVAVTRLGAVSIFPFEYRGYPTNSPLVGIRLPEYMGWMLDTFGVVSALYPMGEKGVDQWLKKSYPKAMRFVPLPRFSSEIAPTAKKFLNYKYNLELGLKTGLRTPSQGFLGLAPGQMGLSAFVGAKIDFKGEERLFSISGNTGLTLDNMDTNAFIPPYIGSQVARFKFDPGPTGSIGFTDSVVFDPEGSPFDLAITEAIDGQVGVLAFGSLMTPLGLLPKIGPAIRKVHQSGAFDIGADVRGAIGVRAGTKYTTINPAKVEHDQDNYSMLTRGRQMLRHYLGGYEADPELVGTNFYNMCFNYGAGILIAAARHAFEVIVNLELSGDYCWTKQPSLLFDGNNNGYWPPFTRVRGDGRLVVEYRYPTWFGAERKRLNYKNGPIIDSQLGTESVVTLTSIEIETTEIRGQDFNPVIFEGTSPQVIRQFLPNGAWAIAPGPIPVLIFTDKLGAGQAKVGLKISLRSRANAWDSPVLIAQTDGVIVDVQVAPRPDRSGWIAVWSEIDKNNEGDIDPPSMIKYAVSDATGGIWPAPQTIAELDSVATQLRLVECGNQIGLLYMLSEGGLFAEHHKLTGLLWDGTSWGSPQTLLDSTSIYGFNAAGTLDPNRAPIQIAYVTDSNKLEVIAWDGAAVSDPHRLAEGAGNDVSMAMSDDGTQFLAWTLTAGGIGLYRYDPAATNWISQGTPFPNALPNDLSLACLSDPSQPLLILAWTETATRAKLCFGFAGTNGAALSNPADLTQNAHGSYFGVNILPQTNREASLLARFRNDTQEELRLFDVGYPVGVIHNDRDKDELDDVKELWIVDADPNDPIHTIDDVRPSDDFDSDGYDNAHELGLDSSPALSTSYPALQVFLDPVQVRQTGAQWRIPGGTWMNSGEVITVAPGPQTIEYKELANWPVPTNSSVLILTGQTATVHYTYSSPQANVSASLRSNPDPAYVGIPLTSIFTVTNHGPDIAQDVSLSAPLPPGTRFVSAAPSQGTFELGQAELRWTIGSLAPGTAASLTVVMVPQNPATIQLTATATCFGDSFSNDDSATILASVVPAVDLALTQSAFPDPAILNEQVTCQIAVANRCSQDASNVVISNRLPANIELISARVSQGSFRQDTAGIIAQFGPLPAGAEAKLILVIRPLTLGILANQASVSATEIDQDMTNNDGEVLVEVLAPNLWVVNTNETGPGSLRQAILEANAQPGRDVIGFNIPGSTVPVIAPVNPLPPLIESVVVDGTTQPGGWIELTGKELVDCYMFGLEITGGHSTVRGLAINNFGYAQLCLEYESGNSIQGCRIGCDAGGLTGDTRVDSSCRGDGIRILNSSKNLIGGTCEGAGNLISGNRNNGILIGDNHSRSNLIQGNLIGLDITGTNSLKNDTGIETQGLETVIGGDTPGSRNIISGNTYNQVQVYTGNNSRVLGNYIGPDISGTQALPSQFGALSIQAQGVQVGGLSPWARNIISGNSKEGIALNDSDGARVQGNYIGVDASGMRALPNGGSGITLTGKQTVTIGGLEPGSGNVISGNKTDGIQLSSYSEAGYYILGNLIGTDRTGTQAIGNRLGIGIFGCQSNAFIGGPEPAARNVISGNRSAGIQLTRFYTHGVVVQGNYIGVDLSGSKPLGNGSDGIGVYSSSSNVVRGNVIAANAADGIYLGKSSTDTNLGIGNVIIGNRIGLNFTGTISMGNTQNGVGIADSSKNLIGGLEFGDGNVIAYNGANGIQVRSNAFGNTLSGNCIYANAALGIELGRPEDGFTANDSDDSDTGPNQFQNYPVLSFMTNDPSRIQVHLQSAAETTFQIELFGSPQNDPSGFGEGQYFLGTRVATTDSRGQATIEMECELPSIDIRFLSATATDPNGNTSEFGPVLELPIGADTDSDGIPDMVEDQAPYQGDANRDGIPDRTQGNVASIRNHSGIDLCLFSPSDTRLSAVQARNSATLSNLPPNVEFPLGLLEFHLSPIPVGSAVPAILLLPDGIQVNTYYKYGATTAHPAPHWYRFEFDGATGAVLETNRIILHFVDGATGDDDQAANGMVSDLGGPALEQRLRLHSLDLLNDGRVQFQLECVPGRQYRIESTTNLVQWTELFQTNAAAQSLILIDVGAPGYRHRFYRAVQLSQ